jgi:hypothetical protein
MNPLFSYAQIKTSIKCSLTYYLNGNKWRQVKCLSIRGWLNKLWGSSKINMHNIQDVVVLTWKEVTHILLSINLQWLVAIE